MSFSKLRKKYVILLWIGIISLFVGHFYLSSLYPDHQDFYSNTLLVVLGLLFLLYVLMNKWFGKEALKILNASTGIDFWYEWSQSRNRARFSISKQSARLASVVYCYMIGDFSSAIDRIEYLQNQNIAKTDRSSLLGIFIKSSLLSGKGISKEEIQKKFFYISFKDEVEKDEALQKQLAIYDILVDQQPNDYFDHVSGSQAFQRLENRYFKGLNAQLKGDLVQATSLFEEIAQEDERLYFVRMAKQWLVSEDHFLSALVPAPKQESDRLATLTADLPLPEVELPKKKGRKKWKWLLLIFPILFVGAIIMNLVESNRPINGIYYLSVDNMETKTASLNKESWIKIDGDHVIVKEHGEEKTYPFDREDIELTVDGKQYHGILQWGSLSLFEQSDSSHDIRTYVSLYSPMYDGYEKGTVRVEKH
ncbi:hypothetical protein [Streptococcus parasanguinis]|uniref:hypothetical protein n=1 Tax=Streptococcus parasanguinis TaxID=1318 RepID=UPI0032198627